MRVNVEELSTPGTKKTCEPQLLFQNGRFLLLQRDRPRREVPWAWWCQTLVSSKSSPPKNPRKKNKEAGKGFDSPNLRAKFKKNGGMILSQMSMSSVPPKHWYVFCWSKNGVFPKTPECDVLNRTGIAGWGLWIPRLWMVPSKKAPTDGWNPPTTSW